MSSDQTVDFVIAFVTIGLVVLGLLSLLIGWVQAQWDRLRGVNYSEDVLASADDVEMPNERTNERTNERSRHSYLWQDFILDKTRTRLIAVMVDSDMTVTEIRALLKGEAKTIGEEIEAERARQGKPAGQPYKTPIAGRPTDPHLYHDDPGLEYKPL